MRLNFLRVTALILALLLCTGCAVGTPDAGNLPASGNTPSSVDENVSPSPDSATLNGIDLSSYTIVYSRDEPDYVKRAAEYIQAEILQRTGIHIAVCEESMSSFDHEIVVGETSRDISTRLDAVTRNVEFSILSEENHIALEGDYFIIAAAAYYFVQTYIPGASFDSTVPAGVSVHSPITAEANNYIFLIGDGMGVYQTRLYEVMSPPQSQSHYDGENVFYGYLLPYQGLIRTNSLSGTTDSAASATALACGVKTINRYVGKDKDLNDVMSLTELAASLGMSTAVMSTEVCTGATPAAFSAHVCDRASSAEILTSQQDLIDRCGTIIDCGLDTVADFEDHIINTLSALDESEIGFFLMYEEAYIDKNSHNMDIYNTFRALVRFNQAIGLFMEYAFYHPDTLLVITADHETGGLQPNEAGSYVFSDTEHTSADVLIFAYGCGAEELDGVYMENTQIPKFIARLWGVDDFASNTFSFS